MRAAQGERRRMVDSENQVLGRAVAATTTNLRRGFRAFFAVAVPLSLSSLQ